MISAVEQYRFDEDAAAHVVEFFRDCLVHVQGPLAGQPFDLLGWQDGIVRELFGWKDSGGFRKHKQAYIEVPRKNGKTTFVAGLALYLLLQGEIGGQVFGCASSLDQASLLFDIAASMVHHSPFLKRKLDVRASKKRIIYRDKNAYYRAVPADDSRVHGTRPTAVLFDELHVQKSRKLWDAMLTGMGTSMDGMFVSITTAGWDRSSICWEQHCYAEKCRDGVIEDPSFLPVLFNAPVGADWTDEGVWEDANPSLDISIHRDFLRRECRRAKEQPSYENTFRNLYLNQWTEQAERWLPVTEWDRGAVELDDDELIGRPCWAGLDLSSTRDVTALCIVFEMPDDVYAVKPILWCPEKPKDTRAQQDRTQVVNWANQGFIRKLPGDVIDYPMLCDQIAEECRKYDVQSIAVDPSGNAEAVMQMLQNDHGWPLDKLEKFAQNYMNYSPAMNDMERRLPLRKLIHDGNPAMRWMISNVAAKTDHNGNIKPDKEKSGDKIDGVVAALMGLGVAIHKEPVETSQFVAW